jgi:hypothetical protein
MRIGRVLMVATLSLFVAVPAAEAGEPPPEEGSDDGTPSTLTPEQQALAEEFQAELEEMLAEAGIDGSVPEIVGEPGDLDLPPGTLVYAGAVDAVATTDLPDGGGSELAGPCMGLAMSFGPDGEVIDVAADFDPGAPPVDLMDGGQAFTASNPYQVDVDGFVAYAGMASPAPIDHEWEIAVQGLNLDSGGDDNPDAEDRNAGTVDLGDDLPAPAKVNALFHIDGEMAAEGGFLCTGSGYIETVGGMPVLGVLGLILLLAGGLGALFNARPARTWKG